MGKRKDYTLSDEQLKQVEWAIAHDERREVAQRATGLRLLHLGYTPEKAGELLLVHGSNVWRWYERFQAGGLDGLANQARRGRPSKATSEYRAELKRTLEREPAAYGYEFAIWTIERLAAHLERQTGIGLSGERLRHLLKGEGYVYRRPKRSLKHLQNAEARTQAEALLDELKKGPDTPILNSSLWTKRP